MKQLKIVLLLAVILGYLPKPKAQTFFSDSTVWFTHLYVPNLSGGSGSSYFKETIRFDSSGTNGEFYRVERTDWHKDNTTYQLRTNDRRVYYTGYINYTNYVTNLLIYDFNLKTGDTLSVVIDPGKRFFQLKLDSIRPRKFEDGVERPTHYYSGLGNTFIGDGRFFATEGIGSATGLVFFQQNYSTVVRYESQSVISVCNTQSLIYGDYYLWPNAFNGNFCNGDTIKAYFDKLSVGNLEGNQIAIYPNPTNSSIHFSGLEQGSFEIYNIHGSLMQSGMLEKEISVRDLVPGIYFIRLFDSNPIAIGSNYYETHKISIQR